MRHWLGTVLFGAFALVCVGMNWSLVWRQFRAKPDEKVPSMIPIVGGVAGFFALRFCPVPAVAAWAWIAFVLDPGCYVSYLPLMMLRRLVRR